MKQFYLKLIYLHSKSIDFLALTHTQFNTQAYDESLITLGDNYQQNLERLIQEMELSDTPDEFDNFDRPVILSDANYPISFNKFKKGEVNTKGLITFNFTIPSNAPYLDGVREIRLKSAKVLIKGARTKSDSTEFTLNHAGNSSFVKADESIVTFNHFSKTPTLRYNISKEKYENNKLFGKFEGKVKSADLKPKNYVGISPYRASSSSG